MSGEELSLIAELINYGSLLDLGDDDQEVPHLIKNVELRRPSAIQAYKKRAGRLGGLTFISPSEHRKHIALNADRKQVIQKSCGGPSLFFTNYLSEDLKSGFWRWFLAFFEFIDSYDNYCIAVNGEGEHFRRALAIMDREIVATSLLREC